MTGNRLLLIDDEDAIAKTVKTIANGCSFDVETTADAAIFLERVANWLPTHVILDLQMPGKDGVELLRELSDLRYSGRIIIASGAGGRVVDAARRLGAERGLDIVATLLKPFRAAEMRDLLTRLAIADPVWESESALRLAITQNQIFLCYQPKIDLKTGRMVGLEALVRWRHPVQGDLFPDQFIPLAERSGLIQDLTWKVIEIGLDQIAEWGITVDASLAINLSGANLRDLSFVEQLNEQCVMRGVDPRRIVLELTETFAMIDPLNAMEILTRLRLKGFALSIDDFGTGYSSLSQLARLPFSEIKVDKSFVMQADRSPEARVIIKSIIDLAHNLGLHVIAEGVESAAIQKIVADLGCDLAQGYHISRPLTGDKIVPWLHEWQASQALEIDTVEETAASQPLHSPWIKHYDGSDDAKAALTEFLSERINPLWRLGRDSLIGWRITGSGIEVLMAPYQNIVDHFEKLERLLRGARMMGDRTFQLAHQLVGYTPAPIELPFRISDDELGAVPTGMIEQVLCRYAITETQHRAVTLFDISAFSRYESRVQVSQLNSLECSINTAQGILREAGKTIDLARTTAGDGFYIWNRLKGPQADLDTYLLTMLVVVDNAIARLGGREPFVPEIRTCFSVGPHYSYHQVDGLDPRGHDYIVGNVTIGLARMISKCLPGQILIGSFNRPADNDADPTNPFEFAIEADSVFDKLDNFRMHGRLVSGIRCYLTGEERAPDMFDVTRYRILDKHGFEHDVFNQKFNIYLIDDPAIDSIKALYVGKQHAELDAFDAIPSQVSLV